LQTKELGLILLIALLAISLVTASLPYTTSQFIDQTTDLNETNYFNGNFDGQVLFIDGNIISAKDINSSGGSSTDTNFETAGFIADDINNALIPASLDTNWENSSPQNNEKMYYGLANDASINYDGSDLVFNSQEVGSGDFVFNGGDVGIGIAGPLGKLGVVGTQHTVNIANAHTPYNGTSSRYWDGTTYKKSAIDLDGTNEYNLLLTAGSGWSHSFSISEIDPPNSSTTKGLLW